MFGNLLKRIAPRYSARLLTILVLTIFFSTSGNAADLRLRINATPSAKSEFEKFLAAKRQEPIAVETVKRLFQEFLQWSRGHERH
jgi:hypothetical protein